MKISRLLVASLFLSGCNPDVAFQLNSDFLEYSLPGEDVAVLSRFSAQQADLVCNDGAFSLSVTNGNLNGVIPGGALQYDGIRTENIISCINVNGVSTQVGRVIVIDDVLPVLSPIDPIVIDEDQQVITDIISMQDRRNASDNGGSFSIENLEVDGGDAMTIGSLGAPLILTLRNDFCPRTMTADIVLTTLAGEARQQIRVDINDSSPDPVVVDSQLGCLN